MVLIANSFYTLPVAFHLLALLARIVSVSGEEEKSNYFPNKPSLEGLPSQQIVASPGLLQNSFKGFRYKDNKSEFRWEEGRNGMAQVSFDSFLPPSITICLRGRILYNRHGDRQTWFSVILNKKNPRRGTFPVDFSFVQKSKGSWTVSSKTVRPYPKAELNKEEQEKAKKAKLALKEQPTKMGTCLCCCRFHQRQNIFLSERKKD